MKTLAKPGSVLLVLLFGMGAGGCVFMQGKTRTYPRRMPVPQGEPSVLSFPMKPRIPPKEKKGWLGIVMGSPRENIVLPGGRQGNTGLSVDYVIQGSPAEKGGLREGDVILSVAEVPLSSEGDDSLAASFKKTIEAAGAGNETALTVLRGGERMDLEITLGSPLKAEPVLKKHPDLKKSGPSLLEATLQGAGILDEVEAVLNRVREGSYEIGSYKMIGEEGRENPFRLEEVNYLLHFPFRAGDLARQLSRRIQEALKRKDLPALFALASDEIDLSLKNRARNKTPGLRDFGNYLEEWKSSLALAAREIRESFAGLKPDERAFLFENAPALLHQDPEPREEEPTKEEIKEGDEHLLEFLRLASRVRYGKLMQAMVLPLGLVDLEYFEYLKALDDRVRELTQRFPLHPGRPGVGGEVLVDTDSEAGRIIVGGPGRNIYTADAALIIDLGGDDIYLNSAGGSRKDMPVSVTIDLSGNDTYRSAEDFVQGSGRMGLGILVDLDGDDIYQGTNYAQGAGFFGLGILYDAGGDDDYSGRTGNQGAGFFGCGLLLDGRGDDVYRSLLYSQGFGMVKGFGALADGTGEDTYVAGKEYPDFREKGRAYQSMSQGFGLGLRPFQTTAGASGGIGVLSDGAGNDVYHASYFSQGSAYWYSLGILSDDSGHDNYLARRYSQGAGIHRAVGVLRDGEGDDQYMSFYGVSQGCGHDESLGLLLDEKGNDRYQGGVLTQGAGNAGGIGVLDDKEGKDRYDNNGNSQAWGDGAGGNHGSFGLLIDQGQGADRYAHGEENNKARVDKKWGVLIDGYTGQNDVSLPDRGRNR